MRAEGEHDLLSLCDVTKLLGKTFTAKCRRQDSPTSNVNRRVGRQDDSKSHYMGGREGGREGGNEGTREGGAGLLM